MAGTGLASQERLGAIRFRTRAWLRALRPRLEARRLEGRAVDGHGDVHLEHVWFDADDAPLLIDCVEFDADLRRVDPASEVAFLAMDLLYRGRPELAEWFLAAYAGRTDDFGLYGVVDFHKVYRALVRAKVAALAVLQPSIEAEQRLAARGSVERHLALAEDLLEPRVPGSLVLMCGTVGSGKSVLARDLGRSGRGVPISSDRVRKSLAGVEADAHPASGVDKGLYRPEQVERVYQGLLERAAPVVDSGRTAILDAGFATRAHRKAAQDWAAERRIRVRLIEVRCRPDVARLRLAARERDGGDASDAGPDFLATSLARFEPPDEWPLADREVVRSD